MYFLLLAQITFYFLGYLRPSIIYDYIDYWPITILPILLVTIFRRASFYELLRNIVNIFLIVVVLIFSFGHLFDSKFLTTYKYDSFFQNNELSSDFNYSLLIDVDGKVNLNSFQGRGYKAEIIDSIPEKEELTIYHHGDTWYDLCRGPHLELSLIHI